MRSYKIRKSNDVKHGGGGMWHAWERKERHTEFGWKY
jgi:hypothetical protein